MERRKEEDALDCFWMRGRKEDASGCLRTGGDTIMMSIGVDGEDV